MLVAVLIEAIRLLHTTTVYKCRRRFGEAKHPAGYAGYVTARHDRSAERMVSDKAVPRAGETSHVSSDTGRWRAPRTLDASPRPRCPSHGRYTCRSRARVRPSGSPG